MSTFEGAAIGYPNETVHPESEDIHILAQMRLGDERAFVALYERHAKAVYAYAASMLDSALDAEEVMQDTFVTGWERLQVDEVVGTSVLPWLLVTCRNKSLNRRRANERKDNRHSSAPVDESMPSTLPSLEDQLIHTQMMAEVTAAVSKLSEIDQSVYRYCLVGQMSYLDAAKLLGVTDGSVRNRLTRLKSKIRHELSILRRPQ